MTNVQSPFKRIYCDMPTHIHELMQQRAKAAGLTNKDYLARLIEKDVKGGKAGKK